MAQRFTLGGKPVRVNNADMLGSGGQAKVLMIEGRAVKWWNNPSRTQVRKVEYLLQNPPKLPERFLFPKEPFRDETGALWGYSMDPLPSNFGEGGILLNKSLRLTRHITTPTLLAILDSELENMNLLHGVKIVQGDVSSRNYAFVMSGKGIKTFKYDTDSFVVAGYPCPVWTEFFLCPDLYKFTDGRQEVPFSETSDRYSYAVILFWSLFNTNPYQQTHPKYSDFREKALKGIWLMDPKIKYPKGLCPHPETISDDLLHYFEGVFKNHNYLPLAHEDILNYSKQLIECPSCQSFYPSSRPSCPNCTTKTAAVDFSPTYRFEKLLETRGFIIFSKYQSGTLFAISLEKAGYFLNIRPGKGTAITSLIPLDKAESFRFDIVGDDYLVANPRDGSSLFVSPIADLASWITTNTEVYKGNRQPVFRGSSAGLYRVAGDQLMLGNVHGTYLVEKPSPIMLNHEQSWIWAEPSGERVLCMSRFFDKYQYDLIDRGSRHEVILSELEENDSLQDISILFGGKTICIRRMINRRGRSVVLTEVFDNFGNSLLSSTHLTTKLPGQDLHSCAFEDGQIFWATDDGVVVESLKNNTFTIKPKTDNLVSAGDKLIHLTGGNQFLVVKEHKVNYLVF